MTLCKDCKHWAPFGLTIDRYEDRATTPAVPVAAEDERFVPAWEVRNKFGLCRKVGGHRDLSGDEDNDWTPRDALAAVEDLSDHAFLRTAPEFGCVLGEPVTPSKPEGATG